MRYVLVSVLSVFLLTGCTHDKILTPNVQQSAFRSGGDLAMTVLLDQGVDKTEATDFVSAVIKFLETGDITKSVFREKVADLAPDKYDGYVDSLFVVIPSSVSFNEKIPGEVTTGLLSFLKDGALRASDLYRPDL